MMSSASETVKKIRDALCMQQEEFGQLLGVTRQTIYNYENGDRNPKRTIVRKLMKIAEKHKIEFLLKDFV